MTATTPDQQSGSRTCSLSFIGNATTLLRWGPFTVLTDPNFLHRGQRAYLGYGLTSRRLTEPAMRIEELPPIDAVVLSHLHGDHWDRISRTKLHRGLPIITTPHAARRLQGWHGFRRAVGLRTWESQTVVKDGMQARVTSLPGRHAPGPARLLLPPVMGSLVEFGPSTGEVNFRLYITGDTLMFPGIEEISRRVSDLHLAVLHLGGTTLPGGIVVTMDADQGADVVELLRPPHAVPIHYDDYAAFKSPLTDFQREIERRGLAGHVTYIERGETHTFGNTTPNG